MSKTQSVDMTSEEIRDIEECRKSNDGKRITLEEFLRELNE